MEYRRERDTMGEIDVPQDAYGAPRPSGADRILTSGLKNAG